MGYETARFRCVSAKSAFNNSSETHKKILIDEFLVYNVMFTKSTRYLNYVRICNKRKKDNCILYGLMIILTFFDIIRSKSVCLHVLVKEEFLGSSWRYSSMPELNLRVSRAYRAWIFKRLRSPEIDSKEFIPPGNVAWRAGTRNRVVVQARQAP